MNPSCPAVSDCGLPSLGVEQHQGLCVQGCRVVASERLIACRIQDRTDFVAERDRFEDLRFERAARTCLGALAFHRPLEGLLVERQSPRLDRVFDEVDRQPVRVVQAERDVAGEDPAAGRGALERFLEPWQPSGQHGIETILLAADDLHDCLTSGSQLGVGIAVVTNQRIDERVEKRLGHPEVLPVAHRATHDLAQHVAAVLVRRDDAVGDEEGHRPHVVGDHAHRHVALGHGPAMRRSSAFADRGEQGSEGIGVVVGEMPLHHGGDALETHAGVDRRRRQRVQACRPAGGRTP